MKINLYYKIFTCLVFALFTLSARSQNVGISSSSSFTPDASAALDVSYTNKGLLIPRVALTANNVAGPVSSPATSLLVYNTATAGTSPNNVVPGYYYWNGSAWAMLTTSAQSANFWSTIGNSGTSYPTNYLGTSDNFGLHVKTNAIHRLWIDSLGSVAVGLSPTFSSSRERFLVDAGSTSANPTPSGAYNVISGKGYLDSYLQLNIQNYSATAAASSDLVASNDAGSETANYIDMGINSSANTSTGVLGGASTAYLYGTGNDFAIGNGTSGKNLLFFTGGTASNERMRIDGTGNVGIGNTSPTQKLDVTGNLKFSGALMPNNSAGTAGYFLVSSGAGAAPTWFNASTYAWLIAGNSGTTAGTNFIGTTDAVDFVIKTNNTERARVSSAGNFGIGTTSPGQKLDVNGNINAAGSIYVDGANSNTGTLNPGLYFGGANSGEVISSKRTSGTNQYGIDFYTASNNRMTIANTGNVGIGITTPATKLHVFGANPLTLSGVVTGTNTTADSLLTITSGLVRKLPLSGFATSSNAWSTTGNAGTSYPSSFVGTTDANGLHFRANSIHGLMLDSLGNVAVGLGPTFSSGNAREKFLVDAGSSTYPTPTGAVNVISGKGYLDNYLQLNIQNLSPTASASTDIVASNDQASETANFIDMGINSSTNNTTGAIGGASTAYIYGTGNDMAIGNGTANKSLIFFTGGTSPTTYTERIRLDASGRVGIGTNAPTSDLTLFQSSGTGGGRGFRFSGNSIGGNNSGTGFLMSLGYNTSNNKQLWLGDPDYAGNSSGTFVRFGVNNGNIAVFDAVAGDNSVRKYLALGVAGDTNSGIILGNDNSSATPGSMVWTNGTMAIGNGYRSNTAPTNGLIVQGNVGIGTTSTNSKLTVAGAITPSTDNNYNLGTSSYRWATVYASNGVSQTSDRRLKTNIKTLNYGLKEVLALQPVSYNWKDKSHPENKIGLIAQDVKLIVPEVVTGNEAKEKLGMNYAELVPVLINAIKEQQKQIDDLKKQVKKLQK